MDKRFDLAIQSFVQGAFLRAGVGIDKLAPLEAVRTFADTFRQNYVAVDLIRIGGSGDGGYLLPNDLEGVKRCFSPGVDDRANFELELAEKFGIPSSLADASVNGAPVTNDRISFEKLFLGSRSGGEYITLSDWMKKAPDADGPGDLILQMDIEGAEYDVFIETPSEILQHFRIMIVEFHSMERIFSRSGLPAARAMFQKLFNDFAVVHVHPNNRLPTASVNGIDVPRLIEVTFLRRDRLPAGMLAGPSQLPHQLDQTNVLSVKDLVLDPIWWCR